MTNAIAIFGASGFVGKNLVSALHMRGEKVIAISRHSTPFPNGVVERIGNFTTAEEFSAILQESRLIIHTASRSTPASTAGKPLDELALNLQPTLALLSALQEEPHCRLLYVSSGGTLYRSTGKRATTESDILCPKSYYGAGKVAAEAFIQSAAQQFGLKTTILRPSNIYGPGQELREGFGIIPTAFSHASKNIPLTLWGDGGAIRDYLYIDDFVSLCTEMSNQSNWEPLQCFNVASGEIFSLLDLLDVIREVSGFRLQVRLDRSRSVDVPRIELDASSLRQFVQWKPQVNLKEGLTRTWHWWSSTH